MYTVTLDVYNKSQFNGVFEFATLSEACQKVSNNLDCHCVSKNAQKGINIYGKAHYFDVFGEGQASIQMVAP